jgi:5-methylcytosine-specific restriction enzyme A
MSCWPYNTRRWERVRQQKLMRNPLCEACLQVGEIVPAEVVDHRTPISKEGREKRVAAEGFPTLDRLASLCASHHNAKTRAEQLGEKDWMRKGCDIFGRPNDPDHPWNKEGVAYSPGKSLTGGE